MAIIWIWTKLKCGIRLSHFISQTLSRNFWHFMFWSLNVNFKGKSLRFHTTLSAVLKRSQKQHKHSFSMNTFICISLRLQLCSDFVILLIKNRANESWEEIITSSFWLSIDLSNICYFSSLPVLGIAFEQLTLFKILYFWDYFEFCTNLILHFILKIKLWFWGICIVAYNLPSILFSFLTCVLYRLMPLKTTILCLLKANIFQMLYSNDTMAINKYFHCS